MNAQGLAYRLVTLVLLVAIAVPAEFGIRAASPQLQLLPQSPIVPLQVSEAHMGLNSVYVDLRDHGPDPQTAIALAGQTVVWINNGTRKHTITEGDPIFRAYMPVLLGSVSADAVRTVSVVTLEADHAPLFDSGAVAVGERFTHTLTSTGTYTYHSAYSPGSIVGTVVVMQAGEIVSETIEMGAALTISATTGAELQIGSGQALTDTTASIVEIPGTALTDTTGTPIGMMYDVGVVGFENVISGYVTVTLPFDPDRLPIGATENDARAYYFNGVRWINAGGQVDTVRNVVAVTTTHLSAWRPQVPCETAFGLTAAQQLAFDRAAAYFHDLAMAQEVFEAFRTSDGQYLLSVDYNHAQWLAQKTLCDLADATEEDVPIDRTPAEVVEDMVAIGDRLLAIEGEIVEAGRILELFETLGSVFAWIEVVSWIGGGAAGFPTSILKEIVVDTLFLQFAQASLALAYRGPIQEAMADVCDILGSGNEVGQSRSLSRVTASEVGYGGACANAGLYHYQVPVPWGADFPFPSYSDAYVNLYRVSETTHFLLAYQSLGAFGQGEGGLVADMTDSVHAFIKYRDINNSSRAIALRFANPGGAPWWSINVAGYAELPDIRPGSQIRVKYILVEDDKLDRRFFAEGTYVAIPTLGALYRPYDPPCGWTQYAAIAVDGDFADWDGLDSFSDPAGDNVGGPAYDITRVATAMDRDYAYLLVETSGKPFSTNGSVEINFDYKPGLHFSHGYEAFADIHTTIWWGNTLYAWTDLDFDGNFEAFPITGYSVAAGNVLEARIPLSQLENARYFNVTFINVWEPGMGQPGNDGTDICISY